MFHYRFEVPLAAAVHASRAAGRAYATLHAQTLRAKAALEQSRNVWSSVVPPRPDALVARIDNDRFCGAARRHEAGSLAALELARARERPRLAQYLEAKRRCEAFERDRERARLRFRIALERRDEAESEEANLVSGSPRRRLPEGTSTLAFARSHVLMVPE